MSDEAKYPHLYFLEPRQVTVDPFDAQGFILDIGGGGEGIIGRLKGAQVIAIDPIKRELHESPAGPLKIIMDARELKFLDGALATATAFFSLMFVKGADHPQVFAEVMRVLAPGGRFLIWDGVIPTRLVPDKDMAAFHLLVHLPGEDVDTGYGTLWPEQVQDMAYYIRLAQDAGFNVLTSRETGPTFFLELAKP